MVMAGYNHNTRSEKNPIKKSHSKNQKVEKKKKTRKMRDERRERSFFFPVGPPAGVNFVQSFFSSSLP